MSLRAPMKWNLSLYSSHKFASSCISTSTNGGAQCRCPLQYTLLEAQNAEGFGISVPDYRLQYKTYEMPKSLRMMAHVLMLLGSFLITFLAAQYFIWTYCTSLCLSLLVVYLYILSMYVSNVLFILSLPFSLPVDFHSLSESDQNF